MSDRQTAELRPPDLSNLAGQETGRDHLSHSSLGIQVSCLKKFDWRYERGLELIERPIALSMGSAFQLGLEHRDPFKASEALRERPTFDQDDEDKLLCDMAIVWAACNGYLIRYPREEHVQAEYEYRIRLRSPYTGAWSHTYDLVGAADGVRDHGAYLELIENKFVGQINATMVKKVRLDRQVGLESYALWRITGKPTRVIRYRWTRKPSIKRKKGETVEQFCDRVTTDYAERPDFYFVEEQTFRSDDDMLVLEQELWDWAEQRRNAKHRGFFTRNTSACGEYGGCDYLDLCTQGDEALSLYRQRPTIDIEQEPTK